MALEPVQERDIVCGEASYERATDAVLLRGELPSEERLAPISGNDSRVIRKLHDKVKHVLFVVRKIARARAPRARQSRVVMTRRRTLTLCRV